MAAAKKTKKKSTSKKKSALKANQTVLRVKLRSAMQGVEGEPEKWTATIRGCDTTFTRYMDAGEWRWRWGSVPPKEWGAILGGICFETLEDAVRHAKKLCKPLPAKPEPKGKKKKSQSMSPADAKRLAELLGANSDDLSD